MTETALIALDWGTSALRAWRVSRSGAVLESRRRDWGIMHLPTGGFEAAFAAVTQDWIPPGETVPAIACGMVGSRQGWREVPYLATPAGLAEISAGLLPIRSEAGPILHLVPGLLNADDEAPDVMRGEETQAIGAVALLDASALLVMPGTHCKWSRLRGGRLVSFRTMMTGELFALLRQHSILGRGDTGVAEPDAAAAAFVRGVRAAHAHGGFARLFTTRALCLTGALPPGCAADYLSGVLIGEELRVATAGLEPDVQIAITGDAALCARYARAFVALGQTTPNRIEDTALSGLCLIAIAAGLLSGDAADGA